MKNILNKFALIGAFLLIAKASHSQEVSQTGNYGFQKGRHTFSLGYGLGSQDKADLKKEVSEDLDVDMKTFIGPIHFSYEYAASNHIGIGVTMNLIKGGIKNTKESREEMGIDLDANIYAYFLMIRGNYHFLPGRKLDPYVGLSGGIKSASYKATAQIGGIKATESGSGPVFGCFETVAGARYSVTKNLGLYAEVGISAAIALSDRDRLKKNVTSQFGMSASVAQFGVCFKL